MLYGNRNDLRRLLVWPMGSNDPARRPDVAIVLVDGDEDRGRKQLLEGWVSNLAVTSVIAVAIQESKRGSSQIRAPSRRPSAWRRRQYRIWRP
jgi:hypothetical protein